MRGQSGSVGASSRWSSQPGPWSTGTRRLAVALLFTIFVFFYTSTASDQGRIAGVPSILYILSAGYLFGIAAGATAGITVVPIGWGLDALPQVDGPGIMWFDGVLIATLAGMGAAGGGIGRLQVHAESAGRALELRNKEMHQLQRAANLGYWSLHRDSRIEWTEELVKVFGFDEPPDGMAEIYGRLHPDDRAEAESNIARLWKGRGPFDGDQRTVWPDGSVHWLHYTSDREKDADGDVVRIFGTAQDITHLKKAEETGRQFQRLLDNLDDVYFTDDLQGNLRVSAAVHEVHGRSPQEFRDNPELWQNVMIDEDRPTAELAYQRILQGRQTEYTVRIRHTDGSVRTVQTTIWPRIDDDQVVGAVGVVHDITAKKEVVRLKELDEMKAVFMSAAAHELNTPLTPLKLQMAILENALPDSKSVQVIKRNVHRMEALVHDLLDAARLQAGRLKYDIHDDMDLTTILTDVTESAALHAQEDGKQWRADIPTALHMRGDPVRLTQVFQNLTSNAIKFTPEGGRITVTTKEEGDHIRIQVQDTGLGLEPDEIQGLFEPFQQFHHGEMGVHRGTGLGLFISKGIVENHQGRIEVESGGEGAGATFTVVLPKHFHSEATATRGVGLDDKEK